MKSMLTLLALVISVTGVFVSIAREELRCYMGLDAISCQSNPDTVKEESPSPEVIQRVRQVIQPSPSTKTDEVNEPSKAIPSPSPIEETKESASNTPSVIEETSQPQSQPIEVIPPPEEISQPQSQPIEVIPQPEN